MIAEDSATFFNTADHGIEATIGAATVAGLFDNGYAEAFGIAAGSKPTFLCAVADLPALTLGTTTAVIDGTTYTIVESQPEGHGLTLLVLEAT